MSTVTLGYTCKSIAAIADYRVLFHLNLLTHILFYEKNSDFIREYTILLRYLYIGLHNHVIRVATLSWK